MKHIRPNFRPIKIPPKLNIHGKPYKPKTYIDIRIKWPKKPEEESDSQTKRNLRK